jgi:hypothetical protein
MFYMQGQQLEIMLRRGDSKHNFAQVLHKYPPTYALDPVVDPTVSTRFSVIGKILTFVNKNTEITVLNFVLLPKSAREEHWIWQNY